MIDLNTAEVGTRIRLPWDAYPWVICDRDSLTMKLRAEYPPGYSGRWTRPVNAPPLMVSVMEAAR